MMKVRRPTLIHYLLVCSLPMLLTRSYLPSVNAMYSSSCLGNTRSASSVSIHYYGECSYSNAVKSVQSLIDERWRTPCAHTAGEELRLLLGASSQADARKKLHDLCQSGYRTFKNDYTKYPTFQMNPLPEESEYEWIQVYGKGALSSENVQPSLWQLEGQIYHQDPIPFYIKRECSRCTNTHKTIIYKRHSRPPNNLDIENLFLDDWYSYPENRMGSYYDFNLYSTLEDAQNNDNPWRRCYFNSRGT